MPPRGPAVVGSADMAGGGRSSGVRLAELVAALSLATDLGLGRRRNTCCGRPSSRPGWRSPPAWTKSSRRRSSTSRCWPGSAVSPIRTSWPAGSATTCGCARTATPWTRPGCRCCGFCSTMSGRAADRRRRVTVVDASSPAGSGTRWVRSPPTARPRRRRRAARPAGVGPPRAASGLRAVGRQGLPVRAVRRGDRSGDARRAGGRRRGGVPPPRWGGRRTGDAAGPQRQRVRSRAGRAVHEGGRGDLRRAGRAGRVDPGRRRLPPAGPRARRGQAAPGADGAGRLRRSQEPVVPRPLARAGRTGRGRRQVVRRVGRGRHPGRRRRARGPAGRDRGVRRHLGQARAADGVRVGTRAHGSVPDRTGAEPAAAASTHRRSGRAGARAGRRLRLPARAERRRNPDDGADPRRRRGVPVDGRGAPAPPGAAARRSGARCWSPRVRPGGSTPRRCGRCSPSPVTGCRGGWPGRPG